MYDKTKFSTELDRLIEREQSSTDIRERASLMQQINFIRKKNETLARNKTTDRLAELDAIFAAREAESVDDESQAERKPRGRKAKGVE